MSDINPKDIFLAKFGSQEHVEHIVNHPDHRVAKFAGSNLNLTNKQFDSLYKRNQWFIDAHLAKNPNTPHHIMDNIVKHEDYHVRQMAAHNTSLSDEHVEKLSHDDESFVKHALAGNPSLRKDQLKKMINDPDVGKHATRVYHSRFGFDDE